MMLSKEMYKNFLLTFIGFALVIAIIGTADAAYQSDRQKFSTLHVTTDKDSLLAGESIWVMFHLELKPGWYTYWENPGDSGLAPQLNTKLPKGYKISKLIFKPPSIIKVGDLVDYGYYDEAFLFAKIETANNLAKSTQPITLALDWVTCKDICVPQQGEVEFKLPIGESISSRDADEIHQHLNQEQAIETVKASITQSNDEINIRLPIATNDINEPFIYIAPKGAVFKPHLQVWSKTEHELSFTIQSDKEVNGPLTGFVKLNDDTTVKFTTENHLVKMPSSKIGIWLSLGFAFLGGILLNIMPCVFPILTLKVVSLANIKQASFQHRVSHSLFYTLGILVAFAVFATVLSSLSILGHGVGWGFQMQSPIFIAIMTYVLFLVSLNLFGWFEFILPLSLEAKSYKSIGAQSFYTGLLMTVVATPCTAPFMAPAMGYAMTQTVPVIFMIFLSLGLGLALPFLIMSMIPMLTAWLPKPGKWLTTFKQCLAFPMLLSTIWLLWLLMRMTDANFVALIMVGLCLISFVVWLSFNQHLSKAKQLIVAVLTVAALSIPFIGNQSLEQEQGPQAFELSVFDDFIGDHSYVFVNATADWCLTCKVNDSVLQSKEVTRYFKEHNIQSVTIDWTKPNPEINQYLERFGRNGVPLYVFYVKGKPLKVLPQWLTPGMITSLIREQ